MRELETLNLRIESHEDKTAKTGKDYTRFKTSAGWMSVFEEDIIKALKENEGKIVNVDIATDSEKGFKNIRKFNRIVKDGELEDIRVSVEKVKDNKATTITEEENISIVMNKTEKPNSYEFGKASNRFKIYFGETKELKTKMEELKEIGIFYDETENTKE